MFLPLALTFFVAQKFGVDEGGGGNCSSGLMLLKARFARVTMPIVNAAKEQKTLSS